MKLGNNWTVDSHGVPWVYHPTTGHRQRGRWAICQTCGEEFATKKLAVGTYCSNSCQGRATGGFNRKCRRDLFEHWTPEECWLAGVIWTDGCFTRTRKGRAVQLAMTDEDVISSAARIIGTTYVTKVPAPPRKPYYRLMFCAHDTMERLAAVGLAVPKLHGRQFPDLPYPRSFLRGAFDGDGYVRIAPPRLPPGRTYPIGYTLVSALLGGPAFIEDVQVFLEGYGITPKSTLVRGPIRRVQWAIRDSLRLEEVMYAEPGPFMLRKRVIFSDYRNKHLAA